MPKFTYDPDIAGKMKMSFDDTFNGRVIRFYSQKHVIAHEGFIFGVAPVDTDINSPTSLWREIMGNEEPSDYQLVMVGWPFIYEAWIDIAYMKLKKKFIDTVENVAPGNITDKLKEMLDYYALSDMVVAILPRNPMIVEKYENVWEVYGIMPEKIEYHNKPVPVPFISSRTENILEAQILKLTIIRPKELKFLFKRLADLELENKQLKMDKRMILQELGVSSKILSVMEKVGIMKTMDTANQGDELTKMLLNKIEGGMGSERRRPEPDEEERDR